MVEKLEKKEDILYEEHQCLLEIFSSNVFNLLLMSNHNLKDLAQKFINWLNIDSLSKHTINNLT